MARWHRDRGKTPAGGQKPLLRKKKQRERGSEPTEPVIGPRQLQLLRATGGSLKPRHRAADTANVYDPKTKTFKQAKLITVTANPANPHYVRRNVITKGAVVRTDIGDARITSRPGQEGVINAVLLETKKEK